MAVWQRTIVDENGSIVPGATITVRNQSAGLPLASLKSDRDGLVNLGNPFTADSDGFAQFFVAGGAYRITATLGAFSRQWDYVAIGTAAETDAGTLPTQTPAQWLFESSVVDSDPDPTGFRLNNADPASASLLYIDNLQVGSVDATTWLDTWDDAGDTNTRGIVEIFDVATPTALFHRWRVIGTITDGGGYRKAQLQYLGGSGSFVAGEAYSVAFWPAGPTTLGGFQLFQATTGLSGSPITLTLAEVGTLFDLSGSAYTINLPGISGSSLAFFGFHCNSGGSLTLVSPDATIVQDGNSSGSSLTFEDGDYLLVVSDGTKWRVLAQRKWMRQGKHTIWVPAAALTPGSGPPVLTNISLAGNLFTGLAFSSAAFQSAFFQIGMPKGWNESTITFIAYWAHPATATNFAVVWQLAAGAASNDDTLDFAAPTAVEVTDTGGTTNDLYISDESSALTISNSPAENDIVCFRIGRDATDVNDTLGVDAYLIGIKILYTTNAGNDA
jgi:hypothetical protein